MGGVRPLRIVPRGEMNKGNLSVRDVLARGSWSQGPPWGAALTVPLQPGQRRPPKPGLRVFAKDHQKGTGDGGLAAKLRAAEGHQRQDPEDDLKAECGRGAGSMRDTLQQRRLEGPLLLAQ